MFYHEVTTALAEGKKVHRLGWPKNDYVVAGAKLDKFELSEEEQKSVGTKEAEAEVYPDALVYVNEGKAWIGHALTHEDKQSGDWHVLSK